MFLVLASPGVFFAIHPFPWYWIFFSFRLHFTHTLNKFSLFSSSYFRLIEVAISKAKQWYPKNAEFKSAQHFRFRRNEKKPREKAGKSLLPLHFVWGKKTPYFRCLNTFVPFSTCNVWIYLSIRDMQHRYLWHFLFHFRTFPGCRTQSWVNEKNKVHVQMARILSTYFFCSSKKETFLRLSPFPIRILPSTYRNKRLCVVVVFIQLRAKRHYISFYYSLD